MTSGEFKMVEDIRLACSTTPPRLTTTTSGHILISEIPKSSPSKSFSCTGDRCHKNARRRYVQTILITKDVGVYRPHGVKRRRDHYHVNGVQVWLNRDDSGEKESFPCN